MPSLWATMSASQTSTTMRAARPWVMAPVALQEHVEVVAGEQPHGDVAEASATP